VYIEGVVAMLQLDDDKTIPANLVSRRNICPRESCVIDSYLPSQILKLMVGSPSL
jgi:hypothetical protein